VALGLPLALPVFLAGVWELTRSDAALVPLVILGGALMYIGVPYVVFMGAVLWWARGRSDTALRRAALWSPVLFAPVAGLAVAVFYGGGGSRAAWSEFLGNTVTGALLCLVLGYGYVVLALAGYNVLLRRGCVQGSAVGVAEDRVRGA
jgi:hypothetical protein